MSAIPDAPDAVLDTGVYRYGKDGPIIVMTPFRVGAEERSGRKILYFDGVVNTTQGDRTVEFSVPVNNAFGENVLKLIDLYDQARKEILALQNEVFTLKHNGVEVVALRAEVEELRAKGFDALKPWERAKKQKKDQAETPQE